MTKNTETPAKSEARKRLADGLWHIQQAAEMGSLSVENSTVRLAVTAYRPDGSGKVIASFALAEFIADIRTMLTIDDLPAEKASWLNELYDLQDRGGNAKALDMLYSTFDKFLDVGHLDRCKEAMDQVDTDKLNSTLCVGFLVATRWAHADDLPNRPALVKRIRSRLEEIAPDKIQALMAGLE